MPGALSESSRSSGAFESDSSMSETSDKKPNDFSKMKINGKANSVIIELPRNHFRFIQSILFRFAS